MSDKPAAYVGMSTTSIRDRIRSHHVAPAKNWFGVLFAVPIGSAIHCPVIEAELIRRILEAGVVSIPDNRAREERWLDSEDVHVTPAVESIVSALEMLLGSDIFTPPDPDEIAVIDPIVRTPRLARVYRCRVPATARAHGPSGGDPLPRELSHPGMGPIRGRRARYELSCARR